MVFRIVEEMPYYESGGKEQLYLDIRKEANAVMQNIQDRGEATVGFTVTENGKVLDTHIVQSSKSEFLDKEATRIISKLDSWTPGSQRGTKVSVKLTVPVVFK